MSRTDRRGRMLLKALDEAAEGESLLASLCAEAADRIRRQDTRIIVIKKLLTRLRRKAMASSNETELLLNGEGELK
jgi:hypothetical protein